MWMHRVQGSTGRMCQEIPAVHARPWGVTGARGQEMVLTSNKSPSGECCGDSSCWGIPTQDREVTIKIISNHRQLLRI